MRHDKFYGFDVHEVFADKEEVNLPRLMIRHMAYVISVPHHELPYGQILLFDVFEVPLDDKEGEEPVKTDYCKETLLGKSQLRRECGTWWLGSGANRESTPAGFQWEEVAEVQGEQGEKEAEIDGSGSEDQFYDAEEGETPATEDVPTAPVVIDEKKKGKTQSSRVDPSESLPDYDLLHLQVEFARALQSNIKFQELLQQVKPNPQPHQNPRTHLD
ncbi:hypothetical protein Dimus_028907 [Dionaea muscipula]